MNKITSAFSGKAQRRALFGFAAVVCLAAGALSLLPAADADAAAIPAAAWLFISALGFLGPKEQRKAVA